MSAEAPAAPSPSAPGHTSRRRALGLLSAGGAAALFASLLGRDEAQAGHDGTNVFHLGVANSNPATPTSLNAPSPSNQVLNVSGRTSFVANAGPPDIAFTFQNTNAGIGTAISAGAGEGGRGVAGVGGTTSDNPENFDSIGVHGRSSRGAGVAGESDVGVGVAGNSPNGVGVVGSTSGDEEAPGTGVGVKASAQLGSGLGGPSDGTALQVLGRAAFTSVGSGVVPAGESSVTIEDPHATESSHISVTLASDPGQREVRWVERDAGSFTVHLTPAPRARRPETDLTYTILEHAEFDCC